MSKEIEAIRQFKIDIEASKKYLLQEEDTYRDVDVKMLEHERSNELIDEIIQAVEKVQKKS